MILPTLLPWVLAAFAVALLLAAWRLLRGPSTADRTASKPESLVGPQGAPSGVEAGDVSLPTDVIEATNLRGAIDRYLAAGTAPAKKSDDATPSPAASGRDERDLALRLAPDDQDDATGERRIARLRADTERGRRCLSSITQRIRQDRTDGISFPEP